MRKQTLRIILFVSSELLFVKRGIVDTGQPPESTAVGRGLDIYKSYCIVCHQADGAGEGVPMGIQVPDFQPAMPLNETSCAWHHGDEQLAQIIAQGYNRMPPFGKVLMPSEIADVVAYMKSLWSPRILACQGPRHTQCL